MMSLTSMPLITGLHVLYPSMHLTMIPFFFFFNDTATTEIYTLSLHDALPIFSRRARSCASRRRRQPSRGSATSRRARDRESTRLNSSHLGISYAVFFLKKKKKLIN